MGVSLLTGDHFLPQEAGTYLGYCSTAARTFEYPATAGIGRQKDTCTTTRN